LIHPRAVKRRRLKYFAVPGTTPSERQCAYQALFKEVLPNDLVETIRTTTLSGLALGNDRFKQEIEALTGQSVRAGKPGRRAKE
jgi:putative transposase